MRIVYSNNPTISDEAIRRYDERIEEIRTQLGQQATEEETIAAVIEDAKDDSSPLHAAYEWDKDKVFEAYLKDRTKQIFRSIEVTIEKPNGEEGRVRKYEFIHTKDRRKVESKIAIVDSPEAMDSVRERLVAELTSMYERYKRYEGVFPELEKLRELAGFFEKKEELVA